MGILINIRALSSKLSGVQRYIAEQLLHLKSEIEPIAPKQNLHGLRGHAWEQFILPNLIDKKLLWSPSNSGPLSVKHQIVTIHDVVPLDHPEWLNPLFAAWYRWLLPKLANKVKNIITVSNFTKERIIQTTGVPPEKIIVIPETVDPRFQSKSLEDIKHIRELLKIPTPYYLLSLCTLEPRKNLHRLLQAWLMIKDKIPSDCWLVLAGGKGKSLIFKQIEFKSIPERVHLTDHVPDEYLPALYSGALVFIYPSVYEGFGLPPLEAMSCGTPVITGNQTAVNEVVNESGLMVDPYDVEAIASGIQNLIEDTNLRRTLGRKGHERAKLFHWEKIDSAIRSALKEAENN